MDHEWVYGRHAVREAQRAGRRTPYRLRLAQGVQPKGIVAEVLEAARERGEPVFSTRIGINSGPAVIGNMGSDLRFDYTAMGDTVNLASRLEGANKAYGTSIMLASSTAEIVRGRIPLRQIDRIRVKGKNVPVDVFTPCEDAALVAATERAWEAYLARDWDGARALWQEIRGIAPGDSLAEVFDKKIAALESSPPPPDWDGSVALDKL